MKRIDDLKAGVAVIILNEENQVLLQKRSDVGLWGIPSGHIEIGETVSEAAIREIKEETNLDIRIKAKSSLARASFNHWGCIFNKSLGKLCCSKNWISCDSEELHRSSPPVISARKQVVIKCTTLPFG